MLSVGLGSSSWALGISVALFTLFSGFCSSFMAILYIRNGQKFNYITILAVAISLDKFNSFAQQIFSLMNFVEIQWKAYAMAMAYFNCRGTERLPLFTAPDDAAQLFLHAQFYLLNMQGLLFFYWSIILFSSAWALSPAWWKKKWVVFGTKVSCFVVPALQLGLMRIPAIQDSDLANLMIMNVLVLINMGMSAVFLILTLIYIISIQRETKGATEVRLSKTYDGVIEFTTRKNEGTLLEKERFRPGKMRGIGALSLNSDGWIIGRIALAFVMVEGLQVYIIVMQIFFLNRWAHFKSEWQQGLSAPAIDQAEEFANICSPIPSSFTGFLFLLVFGTTSESQVQTKALFRDLWAFITCRRKERTLSGSRSSDVEREQNKLRKRAYLPHSVSTYSIPTTLSRDSSISSFSLSPNPTMEMSISGGSAPVSPLERVVSVGSASGRSTRSGLRIVTEQPGMYTDTDASGSYRGVDRPSTAEYMYQHFSFGNRGELRSPASAIWPLTAPAQSPFSNENAIYPGENGAASSVAGMNGSPKSPERGKSDWDLEYVPVMSPMPAARVVGSDEIQRFSSGSGASGVGGGVWVPTGLVSLDEGGNSPPSPRERAAAR